MHGHNYDLILVIALKLVYLKNVEIDLFLELNLLNLIFSCTFIYLVLLLFVALFICLFFTKTQFQTFFNGSANKFISVLFDKLLLLIVKLILSIAFVT